MTKDKMEAIGEVIIYFDNISHDFLINIYQHKKNKKFYLKMGISKSFFKLTDAQAKMLREEESIKTRVNRNQIAHIHVATVAWPKVETKPSPVSA